MRDCDIVVLALGSLLCEISGEGRIPYTDVLSCVEKGIAKIAGSSFLHVSVSTGSF